MVKFYISPDEIEKTAQAFLKKYHLENTMPIPIEEIIEFHLEIDIIPTPDMMDTAGVDAVTSHDLKQINIDRAQLESCPNRARFTLAHEVGHIVLQREFIEIQNFQNEKGWRKFVLNDLHRDPMEVQANMFAAFVLIPSDHLKREYELAKAEIAKHPDFKPEDLTAEKILAPYLAKPLAQKFETSEEAMMNRLINWIQ